MKKFTKEHEWISIEGSTATIGITSHAAHELGDITYVELPGTGTQINAGEVITVIESVKAASDVYSPISGVVLESNQALEGNPQLVNESPEDEGWICKIKDVDASGISGLMDEKEYKDYLSSL